jgi:hypothetical protein
LGPPNQHLSNIQARNSNLDHLINAGQTSKFYIDMLLYCFRE